MEQVRFIGEEHLVISKKDFFYRFTSNQFMIICGSIISAFGFALFQIPFQIAAGGVSGISLIIMEFTNIKAGTLYFTISLPLVIWGFFQLGRWRFVISTINSVIVFSFFLNFFITYLPQHMDVYPITQNILLSSIYAGITNGIGVGLVFRAGGTMGGTGIPARIIQKHTGFPLSQSYLFSDMVIIIAAGFLFSWEKAMLATLTLLLSGMTADFILEGSSQVRIAMIITDKPALMSSTLMAELRRGASMWNITGAYSDSTRTMIYCTVSRSQVSELKYLVSAIDPKAFLVIGNAQQAWGGVGFTHLKAPQEHY